MSPEQIVAFGVLAGMMVLFVWGRLRYDLVAVLALLACVFAGIVPHEEAFTGFGDEIVIIVASALVVSAAVERSGIVEVAIRRVAPNVTSAQVQIVILVAIVTVLSAFVKNIGALAMMIPVAFQMARRSNVSPSCFLMPMAFGSLLGGLTTLVGTSPNIIVARMRAELGGEPFRMFDFAPVGVVLAIVGVTFLAFGYRLLPCDRKPAVSLDAAIDISDYMTEARVVAGSAVVDQPVSALSKLSEHEVLVIRILRGKADRVVPLPDVMLRDGDILQLEGDPKALERAITRAKLELEGEDRPTTVEGTGEEIGGIEAVIAPGSILIGQSARRVALHERYNINLLAVSRGGRRMSERLRDITLRSGDVVVLKGDLTRIPDKLKELGILPLAARQIGLGSLRQGFIPVAVLATAMGLTAFGVLPVATAFFAAAVVVILLGGLKLREAYEAIDWPILVLLGALIPVSEAFRTTGSSDIVAGWLSYVSITLPAYGALTIIMVAAMAVTPFLNNAATVLVMAPIAATFAGRLDYSADPFLMAVAVGAACDFLTPIGHQCNTLVMGPGGYRFGDYWRLGLPLSLIVVALGVPLILLFWPLA